jgi:hypothetical protein
MRIKFKLTWILLLIIALYLIFNIYNIYQNRFTFDKNSIPQFESNITAK